MAAQTAASPAASSTKGLHFTQASAAASISALLNEQPLPEGASVKALHDFFAAQAVALLALPEAARRERSQHNALALAARILVRLNRAPFLLELPPCFAAAEAELARLGGGVAGGEGSGGREGEERGAS